MNSPADLALITAFWLLLMLLRLPLRVDPRYRGRRRVGDPRPEPVNEHRTTHQATPTDSKLGVRGCHAPALPEPHDVVPEPWVPPYVVEDEEYTLPIKTLESELGSTYVSRSRRLNGTLR